MSGRKNGKAAAAKTGSRSGMAKVAPSAMISSVLPGASVETFEKMKRNIANQMENTMQNAGEQIEKVNKEMMGRMEDVAAFNRNNMEAMMQAANVMAEGMKDISQTMMGTVQSSMENAMSTGKAMMGVKNMRDMLELQTQYMKGIYDSLMQETTKVSEIAVRCTSEAAEPISERVNEMVGKITEATRKVA